MAAKNKSAYRSIYLLDQRSDHLESDKKYRIEITARGIRWEHEKKILITP